jgi:hypothetical protein
MRTLLLFAGWFLPKILEFGDEMTEWHFALPDTDGDCALSFPKLQAGCAQGRAEVLVGPEPRSSSILGPAPAA